MNKFLIVLVVVLIVFFIKYYVKGGVYKNKLIKCYDKNAKFRGIKKFKYDLPCDLKSQLELLLQNKNIQKRVNIPKWKAGKTINTKSIYEHCPDIIKWYNNFSSEISELVGEKVTTTQLYLPTSCCVLIYDEKDDFINWHFDVNYFKGRFFTVLIPLSDEITSTKFIYKDKNEKDVSIELIKDNCIVFEGDNLFHMASKLDFNQKRVILCLQYTTNNHINFLNKILMNVKDIAYIGI